MAVKRLSLSYNHADSQTSALRLILAVFPDWDYTDGEINLVRFTEGITNTLLKAVKGRPGYSEEQMDNEAVMLRAYGEGTDVLIDRERETTSHLLLAQHKLAAPLLARFQNGLMYRFMPGHVCTYQDFARERVWKGVARRLGEWHAVMPVVYPGHVSVKVAANGFNGIDHSPVTPRLPPSLEGIRAVSFGTSVPNVWTALQQWVCALPTGTKEEQKRKAVLHRELERTIRELGEAPGLGTDGLVFGHCDLLSGNCIIEPPSAATSDAETVSFIDYEYSIPCPAAFDIANHFAEWGGLDCDYATLPTRSVRRRFLREYLVAYANHRPGTGADAAVADAPQVEQLFAQVDRFRGVPGLYWGIWALIQATISPIDFDYAAYAQLRLAEYWGWRGSSGLQMGLREKRWAQE